MLSLNLAKRTNLRRKQLSSFGIELQYHMTKLDSYDIIVWFKNGGLH